MVMAEPNGGVSGESASILVERLRFSTSFKTNHVFKGMYNPQTADRL
jgi:hypothetical protein